MRLIPFLLLAGAAFAQFRVGPVYTKNFPDLDIVVEPPPSQSYRAGDFVLLEDGAPGNTAKNMRRFHETGEGVSVVLLVDVSGSMRGRPIQAVREGLAGYVDRARDNDRILIVTVADETKWEVATTDSREQVKKTLEGIDVRGTRTRLWDGIDEALFMLDRNDSPARKRLVVISDGHDEGSTKTLAEVIARAQRTRIPIDAVGITRARPEYLLLLRKLCIETKGTFRVARDTEELKDHTANGIQQILDTPVLTFRAKKIKADGEKHAVGVRWDSNGATDEEQVVIPKSESWFRWWYGLIALAVVAAIATPLALRKPKKLPPPTAPIQAPLPAPVSIPKPTPIQVSQPQPVVKKHTEFATMFPPPSATGPSAMLIGVEGPAQGMRVAVDRTEFWIGAESNNQCVIAADSILSGHHACIAYEGGSLRIFDNQSTNGTWVNNERLSDSARLLALGDRIRAGRSVFLLEKAF